MSLILKSNGLNTAGIHDEYVRMESRHPRLAVGRKRSFATARDEPGPKAAATACEAVLCDTSTSTYCLHLP